MNKARAKAAKSDKSDGQEKAPPPDGTRETIESIAMAIVLALIFRSFVAEAFVIPTGSMAPTLVGRHKDVYCPECGHRYQTGASNEVTKEGAPNGDFVVATICPMCRNEWTLDLYTQPNEDSFSGDRIIVGKFAYDLSEPQRWDVIVFKFPGNARDNYIKRLVGLPGETVRIVGGNVYTRTNQTDPFRIARKPPHKLDVLLQAVHDTKYLSPALAKVKWPELWQPVPQEDAAAKNAWEILDDGHRFHAAAKDESFHWLRYKHLLPDSTDWDAIARSQLPDDAPTRTGGLITDFYAYNAGFTVKVRPQVEHFPGGDLYRYPDRIPPGAYDPTQRPQNLGAEVDGDSQGLHWVDDLAVDADVDVKSAAGEIALAIVRGGAQHRAIIDVATGNAKLEIVDWNGASVSFVGDAADAQPVASPTAKTSVKGPGKYQLRLSNCDHELLLWVNGSVVKFDQPTTYASADLIEPHWTKQNPGDVEPALIGVRSGEVEVNRLRVLRDKYYIAVKGQGAAVDYANYNGGIKEIGGILSEPDSWSEGDDILFKSRRDVEFDIPADCFFPMGDNSPHSQDARMWAVPGRVSPLDPSQSDPVPHYVKRDLLVGKALIIYWPHAWNRPYLWPNFSRMKWIR